MSMQQLASNQVSAEIAVNRNFQTLEHQACYGQRQSAHSGLTWAYYGGRWGGFSVADGTLALTDATTNYVVVALATGVISVSTSTTNWNDNGNYARVYRITTAASAVTNNSGTDFDYRAGPGGVSSAGATGVGDVVGPASATDSHFAQFDGTSGTLLKDGLALDTDATLAANSNTRVPSQAAVKAYADALVAGLSWKQAVRAATTAALTLATDFENGDTIDGVVLATGNRILVKNQAAGAENGIYIVAASGAPTRATDADSGAELVNASVYVSEGTTLADTQWTCTTNATITVGTTALAFAQLTSGGGSNTFGTIVISGQSDVVADSTTDTLTLVAGSNITLTTNAGTDTITIAAAGGGSGTKTYAVLTPMTSQPPATAFATLDTRNSIAVLDFDTTTEESATWVWIVPEGASLGSGLIVRIHWMATSATTGDVRWGAQFERMNTDLDANSYDTATEVTTTTNGTSGIVTVTAITCTTIDSVTAGDACRLSVYRDVSDAADTMADDAELVCVEIRSAA